MSADTLESDLLVCKGELKHATHCSSPFDMQVEGYERRAMPASVEATNAQRRSGTGNGEAQSVVAPTYEPQVTQLLRVV